MPAVEGLYNYARSQLRGPPANVLTGVCVPSLAATLQWLLLLMVPPDLLGSGSW